MKSGFFASCGFDEGCDVESVAMKQLPDILTSATFWASLATLWAASGAWFTCVASEVASRKKKYDGILSLIKGLEAELALVSEWASGEEGAQGYPVRTRLQLVKEHPDWFNPSRMESGEGTNEILPSGLVRTADS